jgi:hypothetical protein
MEIDESGLPVSSSFAGGDGTAHAAWAATGLAADIAKPRDTSVRAVIAPAKWRSVLFM